MQQNDNIFNCRIDTIGLKKGSQFIYQYVKDTTVESSKKRITLFIIKSGLVELSVNNDTWDVDEKSSFASDQQPLKIGISAMYNDADIKLISFNLDLLLRLGLTNRLLYNAHQWLVQNKNRVWITKTDSALESIELVEMVIMKTSDKPMNQELQICALKILVYEIIGLLNIPQIPAIFSNRKQSLYTDFYNLVIQHYRVQHKVCFYADKLCITVKYLSTITKGQCGKTASEIINIFLTNEAKRLLEGGRYSISQIADILNFSDQFVFGKFFKIQTGFSPKRYLNEINKVSA